MERVFQKSVFGGIFTDMEYNTPDKCGGHDYAVAKDWLTGFYLTDETIKVQKLTNEQLTAILDPTSDSYRDLISFVYDTKSFDWCGGSEAWFVSAN